MLKKPRLKKTLKTLSINVAVLQFGWKVVLHRWCRWAEAALTETRSTRMQFSVFKRTYFTVCMHQSV